MLNSLRSVIFLATLLAAANSIQAGILRLEIGGIELTNSPADDIASDAIVVTFDDMGTSGSVRVTIDFQGGTGVDTQAKLNDIVFNLDPSQSISSFAFVEGIAATKNGTQQIFYSAAGVGTGALAGANILFDFPPPGHDPPLQPGSKSVYDIFGSAGLTAASFNVSGGSQPATSPFIAAVHINAVNNGESGHFKATVTTPPGNPPHHTPEPGAMAIFAAFTGLLAVGRKRKA